MDQDVKTREVKMKGRSQRWERKEEESVGEKRMGRSTGLEGQEWWQWE